MTLCPEALQHIEAIATDIVKTDLKKYDWMKKENFAEYVKYELTELLAVREALLTGTYYTCVDSVAKSGMSRTIRIKYIKDNVLHNVTDAVYRLAGCDKNRRISGCGMDMLFHAQYNLFVQLCPDLRYQSDMQRYNSL